MAHRVILSLLLSAAAADGQVLIEGYKAPVRLQAPDASILDGHQLRTELPCAVKPVQPELALDLDLHSGYEVNIPFADLAGHGKLLTAIFRVIPAADPDQASYFIQKWRVPPLAEDARGVAVLRGKFLLGEGKYEVEWLMRDGDERYCSARWQIAADRHGRDKQIELRLPPGTARAEPAGPFAGEAAVTRDASHGLHVVVLFHVASQVAGAAGLSESETAALVSILRRIAREPRIGSYSIAAFNLERNELLFRRENAPQVDFPALGEGIQQLRLGTVDVHTLQQTDAGMHFLGELVSQEMTTSRADAVIFVGPKTSAEFRVHGALKDVGELRCPVFYLDYDANPTSNPWHDAIGSLVRGWKGSEYTISKPHDLFVAWNEVMSRISSGNAVRGDADRAAAISGLVPKK